MKRRLARESGGLKDSFGAWMMTDEEEEKISSSLKKNWKKTTNAIRSRVRISKQAHSSDETSPTLQGPQDFQ